MIQTIERMTVCRLVWTLLPILTAFTVRAEVTDSLRAEVPSKTRGIVGVAAGVNTGYILPHNPVVKGLLTGRNLVTASQVSAVWRANASNASEDDLMYGLPRFEAGLMVFDFSTAPLHRTQHTDIITQFTADKPSSIGQMITPYAAMNRPLVRGSRMEFGYRLEQGFGISTRPYNKQTNPENELIGSPVSVFVGLGFYADARLSSHWTIGLTGNFHHYSNGRMREPNIGVNPIDAGVRAVYTFAPDTACRRPFEWFRLRHRGDVNYRKHLYGDFAVAYSPRQLLCEWNYSWYSTKPEDPRYRTGRFKTYYTLAFNAALMYAYSPKYASGVGLEYIYAPIGEAIAYWERQKLEAAGTSEAAIEASPKVRVQGSHGLSAVLHHEARYKNLAIHLGLGFYIKPEPQYPGDVDLPFYETAALRYYLPIAKRRLYLGYNIRAHAITADSFHFFVGYAPGR